VLDHGERQRGQRYLGIMSASLGSTQTAAEDEDAGSQKRQKAGI
jgi:hypothetical protein